jgi:hypothetical protein
MLGGVLFGGAVFGGAVFGGAPIGATASDDQAHADLESDNPARALAERHAPRVVLKNQAAECDRQGEGYFPAPVEVVLDNPEVLLRQVGQGDPVVMRAPGARDLFGLGEGFYLDFPGSSLSPGCIFERDFQRYVRDLVPTTYAHVVIQPDRPDQVVLQYWFYWYFNDWNNTHESDWEGIQLVFEASSISEALQIAPSSVGFAQHEGGEKAQWDDSKLERIGDRPVVYASAGSHASYFSSDVFLGRSASEGFGCDDTSGPSSITDPAVVLLPSSVDDADDPLAWLAYEGRWGERQSGPFNGPTGPTDKDRWTHPMDWHDQLRPSSALVPAGDGRGALVVQAFCGVVEWGSLQLIQIQMAPLRLVFVGLVLAWLARVAVRRTAWSRVAALPVRARRRAGEIFRATAVLYRRLLPAVLVIGAIYVPISLVVAGLVHLLRSAPVIGPIAQLGGATGETSVLLALGVGGLANLLAYQAVSVGVCRLLLESEPESRPGVSVSGRRALREAWSMWHPLLTALLRAIVIVGGLLITVIGAPVAIWCLVRYQFLAQAVAIEGRSGSAALRRSAQLVRGRWLHTAVVTALINAALLGISATVGLLLLVAVNGVPLWVFSVIVNLVAAGLVPLAAVAQTLLYGDAAAQQDGLGAAPPIYSDQVESGARFQTVAPTTAEI